MIRCRPGSPLQTGIDASRRRGSGALQRCRQRFPRRSRASERIGAELRLPRAPRTPPTPPRVSVSRQRPFTPLLMKTSAPASQNAPPSGTLLVAFFFIQSNEQCSRIASQRDSSIGMSRNAAMRRHLPRHVALEIREVDEQHVGQLADLPTSYERSPRTARTDGRRDPSSRASTAGCLPAAARSAGRRGPACRSARRTSCCWRSTWWLYMLHTTSRPSRPI